MIDVRLKFSTGKPLPISVKNSATVSDVLEKAGVDGSYTIKVNGATANMETDDLDGKLITLSEKVKGGSK